MHPLSRRDFHAKLIGSAVAFGLIETLWTQNLFADGNKAPIGKWLHELYEMSQDLRGHKLTDVQFQTKMDELYARVDLPALCGLIDLDKMARSVKYPERGAASLGFDLEKVEGLPQPINFGKQIFAVKKGRSVVPHGHANMCTGFIVLRGEFHGRHYDKLETHADHYVIRPTIDKQFQAGGHSTISDHKDNIHWFEATSETGFIFNVHVIGYDETITEPSGRLYLDPAGEKVAGGLIKAKKMTSAECHKKYG